MAMSCTSASLIHSKPELQLTLHSKLTFTAKGRVTQTLLQSIAMKHMDDFSVGLNGIIEVVVVHILMKCMK